jgi:hypothetical protein
MKDLQVILLSEYCFRYNRLTDRHVLQEGVNEIFHVIAKINVDFDKKSVSILHLIFFAFIEFSRKWAPESPCSYRRK